MLFVSDDKNPPRELCDCNTANEIVLYIMYLPKYTSVAKREHGVCAYIHNKAYIRTSVLFIINII